MAGTREADGSAGEAAATRAVESSSPASDGKAPRTARGERTLRKILDAALEEFGEKGFSEGSIVGITSRARVALGTFYTYFDSKEAVFQEVVRDMSAQVRDHVAPVLQSASGALEAEGLALESFLRFVATHRQVYRIIDEAEFVDPDGFRKHYMTTAERIAARLQAGKDKGEVVKADSPLATEVEAWAIMGMNVFLGLRFGVWGEDSPAEVTRVANQLIRRGLKP
ncbi:TetR/AcrR family transcriptional regulator [Sphingomonas daechungensis]|uniref:TetR/AcrR family transcriptional regulator n=1 Tax=Sphingomonas daechungensis TaxID=1176646 RepID=UPI003784490D